MPPLVASGVIALTLPDGRLAAGRLIVTLDVTAAVVVLTERGAGPVRIVADEAVAAHWCAFLALLLGTPIEGVEHPLQEE